jgi:hypothetical protein
MTEPEQPLDYESAPETRRDVFRAPLQFSLTAALPAALFLGAFTIILVFIIPRLETTFKDFGVKLPAATNCCCGYHAGSATHSMCGRSFRGWWSPREFSRRKRRRAGAGCGWQ